MLCIRLNAKSTTGSVGAATGCASLGGHSIIPVAVADDGGGAGAGGQSMIPASAYVPSMSVNTIAMLSCRSLVMCFLLKVFDIRPEKGGRHVSTQDAIIITNTKKGHPHMHLAKTFLEEIDNPSLTVNERASLRCRVARQLEEAGDYEAASEALAELWQGVGARPMLEGLDDETKAQVLLRVGTLKGWIGSASQT